MLETQQVSPNSWRLVTHRRNVPSENFCCDGQILDSTEMRSQGRLKGGPVKRGNLRKHIGKHLIMYVYRYKHPYPISKKKGSRLQKQEFQLNHPFNCIHSWTSWNGGSNPCNLVLPGIGSSPTNWKMGTCRCTNTWPHLYSICKYRLYMLSYVPIPNGSTWKLGLSTIHKMIFCSILDYT